jgi:hypothetical protein
LKRKRKIATKRSKAEMEDGEVSDTTPVKSGKKDQIGELDDISSLFIRK